MIPGNSGAQEGVKIAVKDKYMWVIIKAFCN